MLDAPYVVNATKNLVDHILCGVHQEEIMIKLGSKQGSACHLSGYPFSLTITFFLKFF